MYNKANYNKNSQYFFSTFRDCLIANDDYNGYLDFLTAVLKRLWEPNLIGRKSVFLI